MQLDLAAQAGYCKFAPRRLAVSSVFSNCAELSVCRHQDGLFPAVAATAHPADSTPPHRGGQTLRTGGERGASAASAAHRRRARCIGDERGASVTSAAHQSSGRDGAFVFGIGATAGRKLVRLMCPLGPAGTDPVTTRTGGSRQLGGNEGVRVAGGAVSRADCS